MKKILTVFLISLSALSFANSNDLKVPDVFLQQEEHTITFDIPKVQKLFNVAAEVKSSACDEVDIDHATQTFSELEIAYKEYKKAGNKEIAKKINLVKNKLSKTIVDIIHCQL